MGSESSRSAKSPCRGYGVAGPWVVLLHGGPGAPGTMAPVARGLEDRFRVLEPWQRRSDGAPLTVARHVADLQCLIATRCASAPHVVGSSWGAMLALAHAAAHPDAVASLVLVGCGTFDPASRRLLHENLERRTSTELRRRIQELEQQIVDPDERLRVLGELLLPVYSHELLTTDTGLERCDAGGHHQAWQDMLHRQRDGTYPAAFARITAPVLMLHGTEDPHPGPLIRDSLRPFLKQLEYHEWPRCGHFPWLEQHAWQEFYRVLRAWLSRQH